MRGQVLDDLFGDLQRGDMGEPRQRERDGRGVIAIGGRGHAFFALHRALNGIPPAWQIKRRQVTSGLGRPDGLGNRFGEFVS